GFQGLFATAGGGGVEGGAGGFSETRIWVAGFRWISTVCGDGENVGAVSESGLRRGSEIRFASQSRMRGRCDAGFAGDWKSGGDADRLRRVFGKGGGGFRGFAGGNYRKPDFVGGNDEPSRIRGVVVGVVAFRFSRLGEIRIDGHSARRVAVVFPARKGESTSETGEKIGLGFSRNA